MSSERFTPAQMQQLEDQLTQTSKQVRKNNLT